MSHSDWSISVKARFERARQKSQTKRAFTRVPSCDVYEWDVAATSRLHYSPGRHHHFVRPTVKEADVGDGALADGPPSAGTLVIEFASFAVDRGAPARHPQ